MRNLTEQEEKVLKLFVDAANETLRLPVLITEDQPDVFYHLRAIQNIILARPAFEHQNIKS